jgi:hypothetical protein
MRWAEHVACLGEEKKMYVLLGKPEEKKPLRRLRHQWDDGIRMDLEIGWCVCVCVSVWSGFIWLKIRTRGGLS